MFAHLPSDISHQLSCPVSYPWQACEPVRSSGSACSSKSHKHSSVSYAWLAYVTSRECRISGSQSLAPEMSCCFGVTAQKAHCTCSMMRGTLPDKPFLHTISTVLCTAQTDHSPHSLTFASHCPTRPICKQMMVCITLPNKPI